MELELNLTHLELPWVRKRRVEFLHSIRDSEAVTFLRWHCTLHTLRIESLQTEFCGIAQIWIGGALSQVVLSL